MKSDDLKPICYGELMSSILWSSDTPKQRRTRIGYVSDIDTPRIRTHEVSELNILILKKYFIGCI